MLNSRAHEEYGVAGAVTGSRVELATLWSPLLPQARGETLSFLLSSGLSLLTLPL